MPVTISPPTPRSAPVAGRARRSPALERRPPAGARTAPPGAPRRRRSRRARRGVPLPLLLLCVGALVGLFGCRWWAGGRPAGVPGAVAPPLAAPAPPPPGAGDAAPPRPVSVTLPAEGLLSTAPPALPAPHPDAALQALIETVLDTENGTAGVAVRHLGSGAGAAYHDADVYRSASLAKVPILVETFRRLAAGTLSADERLLVSAESITDGAGVLQARAGDRLPVSELLRLSVSVSDNTAARLLLQRVGGVEAVNRTMAALGLTHTRLYADDRPNTTTAAETAALLAWIATRTPLTPGSAGSARRSPMSAAPAPGTLAALLALPQAQAWLTERLPAGAVVAHKSGQLPGVRHEAGIVYGPGGPIVIVVLTDNLAHQGDAEETIAALARGVYEHFARR